MKKARMNISHSRFILFKLKIFGEIVTTFFNYTQFFLFWFLYRNIFIGTRGSFRSKFENNTKLQQEKIIKNTSQMKKEKSFRIVKVTTS